MSEQHARLAPSSAPRWVPCPGSVVMQEQFPESDEWSQPREDGTAAHWVADSVLKADTPLVTAQGFLGLTAPNGVIISQEMIDAVEVYVADVRGVCEPLTYLKPWAELGVTMLNSDPTLAGHNWGTLDCAAADGINKKAYLWDFKYGWDLVPVEMNYQMLNYLLGIVEKIAMEFGVQSIPELFEIRIVQPRPYSPKGPVRVWRISYPQLIEYTERLWASAREAVGPNPTVIAGPQCKNCSARHACPSLNDVALQCVTLAEAAIPAEMTPEQLGKQLTEMKYAFDMLKARITGLETQALAEVRAGKYVPGWEGKASMGNLNWTRPIPEVIALGKILGIEVAKEAAITPLQAIKAGVPEALVKQYSGRSSGGLQLVKADPDRIENRMKGDQ